EHSLASTGLSPYRKHTAYSERKDRLSKPGADMTGDAFDQLLEWPQYCLPQPQKESLLVPLLNELTDYHRARCPEYARLVSLLYHDMTKADSLAEVPFVP